MIPDARSALLCGQGDVAFRLMRDDDADYRLVTEWLSDERVAEWFGGRDRPHTFDELKDKYRARLGGGSATPTFMLKDGEPIGFLQFYWLGDADEYDTAKGFGITDREGAYGIDLYIGKPELWGRGVGSRAVAVFTRWLFDDLDATVVYADPRVANPRSIRAFEKAGFTKVRILPGHERHEGADEDCWLLEARRSPSA